MQRRGLDLGAVIERGRHVFGSDVASFDQGANDAGFRIERPAGDLERRRHGLQAELGSFLAGEHEPVDRFGDAADRLSRTFHCKRHGGDCPQPRRTRQRGTASALRLEDACSMDADKPLHVLKPGTWNGQNGPVTFTDADMARLVKFHRPGSAPIVIGHEKPNTTDPALGWLGAARLREDGSMELDPAWTDRGRVVRDSGEYNNLSLELMPSIAADGLPYLRVERLGMLGAHLPAVKGLDPIVNLGANADGQTVLVTLAAGSAAHDGVGAEPSSSDLQTASRVLGGLAALASSWRRLFGAAALPIAAPNPQLAAGTPGADPDNGGDDRMTDNANKDLSAREAALTLREQALEQREAAQAAAAAASRSAAALAFAQSQASAGRLLPAELAPIAALLAHLDAPADDGQPAAIQLAAAAPGATPESKPAADWLREFLQELPARVPMGTVTPGAPQSLASGGQGAGAVSANFYVPNGAPVDAASLVLHEQAVALAAADPKLDYNGALVRLQQAS